MLIVIFEKYSIKVTFFAISPLTSPFQPFFLAKGQKFLKKRGKSKNLEFKYPSSPLRMKGSARNTQYALQTKDAVSRRFISNLPALFRLDSYND